MSQFFQSLAKVAATKVVGWLAAFGVAAGVIVPQHESASLTVALTAAITAGLQLIGQIVLSWAEKRFPWLAQLQPMVFRVLVRKPAATGYPSRR